ncbi:hypothetical protein L6452_38511 [Arctium lappa]|uniref:Uncharacterized protein n=1 Tax=Arctium lappa TaxID=4217 RepID=A0ACB8XTV4_ARCLA|nr:hypothetical protein L6452_38511 [Arctium lappa]
MGPCLQNVGFIKEKFGLQKLGPLLCFPEREKATNEESINVQHSGRRHGSTVIGRTPERVWERLRRRRTSYLFASFSRHVCKAVSTREWHDLV